MPYLTVETKVKIAAHAIKQEAARQLAHWLISNDVAKIAAESGLDNVKSGAWCFAIRQGEMILAFDFQSMSPARAKTLFHLHRIVNILFPHNFPRIATSCGKLHGENPDTLTRTARQFIEGPATIDYPTLDRQATYPFQKAWEFFDRFRLPIHRPDRYGDNFILGPDNGVYYVDTLLPIVSMSWPTKRIVDYMTDHGYKKTEIDTVVHSIHRLNHLSYFLNNHERGYQPVN